MGVEASEGFEKVRRSTGRGSFPERKLWAEEEVQNRLAGRIEKYGAEIGPALHEVLDPSLDSMETDIGRDIDRKGLLVEALDYALQSEDPFERRQALRLLVDTIEAQQTHRHRELRMR